MLASVPSVGAAAASVADDTAEEATDEADEAATEAADEAEDTVDEGELPQAVMLSAIATDAETVRTALAGNAIVGSFPGASQDRRRNRTRR
jgi:hypothetical protein